MSLATDYQNITKDKDQEETGTTGRVDWFWVVMTAFGITDLVLVYSTFQLDGAGENISNLGLIPLAVALCMSMILSAHYGGKAIRQRSKKSIGITLGLGAIFLFIIGYLRANSDAPFILTLANIGFFGICAYLSYLRAEHQDFFDAERERDSLTDELANLQSDIKNRQSDYEEQNAEKMEDSRILGIEKADEEEKALKKNLFDSNTILKAADQYKAQRLDEIKHIEEYGLIKLGK